MQLTSNLRAFALSLLKPAVLLTGALLIVAPVRAAESFRYSLASQQEFGRKLGFKLAFEGNTPDIPRHLDTLGLVLSVADGKSWRFPMYKPQWQWDHDYSVKAIIGARSSELWVDGERVLQSEGGFVPSDAKRNLEAGLDSRNMDGTTDYRVLQTSLCVSTDKGQTLEVPFPKPETRPFPVFLFEPQTPVNLPWKISNGENITIETSFRLLHAEAQTVAALAPFVDRFGQSVQAQWLGKIHDDTEFKAAIENENEREAAYGLPSGYDRYGGSTTAGWKEHPTGFFRTTRKNGFWWLVSPEGNPCFYVGVDTVNGTSETTPVAGRESFFDNLPPKEGEFAPAWSKDGKAIGFSTANLIRRYGSDWESASWKNAENRLRAWGFSGIGKWSGIDKPDTGPVQLPCQPVLRRTGVPTIGRMPDIFDENVRSNFRATLEKTIVPNLNNPYVLGWSLGNEHDEIVLPADIKAMLGKEPTVPAKRALVSYALNHIYGGDASRMAAAWKTSDGATPDAAATREALEAATPQVPAEDIETLRRYFADQYYSYIYKTIKGIDPNHLYFGFWIGLGWWENDEDWRISTKYCDIVGYDAYRYDFADNKYAALIRETDKPVMCGEFSYPSWYQGSRGNGAYNTATPDDASSGQLYARWVAAAARDPHTVGMHWFQYRDQPISGRSAGGAALAQGEHYAFGLVDITDRPKWDLIDAMRKANLTAVTERQKASFVKH